MGGATTRARTHSRRAPLVTKKQAQRGIEQHVAPLFPAFRVHGDLLLERRGVALVRGFAFERSQLDKNAFRLRAFAQVLSVPREHIDFVFSEKLGDFAVNGSFSNAFRAAAERADLKGRAFLECVRDCEALIANEAITPPTTDPRLAGEARAHCLVFTAQYGDARAAIRDLVAQLTPPEVPYEKAMLARLLRLEDALDSSGEDGIALLEGWAGSTAEALGL